MKDNTSAVAVDLAPNLEGCLPLVCACFPTLLVGVTCRVLTDDCADICQSDRDASVHGAQPAMAVGNVAEACHQRDGFMVELVSKKEAWRKEEQQHVVSTLSSTSLRASIPKDHSCASDEFSRIRELVFVPFGSLVARVRNFLGFLFTSDFLLNFLSARTLHVLCWYLFVGS